MDLSPETTTALYKNTIKYLYDITEKVPNTLNVLKSYYASKFTISQLQTKINLEPHANKYDPRCRKCCLKLRQTGASYAVSPENKKSRFARKVLKKAQGKDKLTKFQTEYLKRNDLRSGNRLVVTCGFCKNKAAQLLNKPAKIRRDVNANQPPCGHKRKRKRKKDKFCGLQEEAVVSAKCGNNLGGANVKGTQKGSVNQDSQNRVLNNPIFKQRENQKKKKNLQKLNLMLQQSKNVKAPKNNLAQFLQSLSCKIK